MGLTRGICSKNRLEKQNFVSNGYTMTGQNVVGQFVARTESCYTLYYTLFVHRYLEGVGAL